MQFTDGADELSVPSSNSSDGRLEQTSNNESPKYAMTFANHTKQLRSPINPKFFTGNLENSFRRKTHFEITGDEDGKDYESIPITRKTDVEASELLTPKLLPTSLNNHPRKMSSKLEIYKSKEGTATNLGNSSFREEASTSQLNEQKENKENYAKSENNVRSQRSVSTERGPRGMQTRKSLLRMISFNRRSSIFISHKPIKVQSTKKALDLVRDKATNLYNDEANGKHKVALTKFRNIMKKHAKYDKKSGMRFFDLTMNAVIQMRQSVFAKVMTKFKKKLGRLKKVSLFLSRVIKKIKEPLKPDSSFHFVWDVLLLLFIMHDLIVLPFNMSFERPLEGVKATNIIENAETWFFIVDIILNFHTAFYREGNLVVLHKAIILQYLRSWFLLDLVSSFPFTWLTSPIYSDPESDELETLQSTSRIFKIVRALRFIKIVRIVRVVKVKKILDRMDYFIQSTAVINAILSLLKLSAVIFFVAHWCACIWYLIGANGSVDNWVAGAGLEGDSIANRYIASLYFTITTMMTVGYGDIIPANSDERIFSIFMMITGGGVFGYTINSIATIVQSMEGEKSKAKKKIFMITKFMQRKGLTKEVQARVRKYLELMLENEDGIQRDEADLLQLLSENLREEVFQQINGKFLNDTPSFYGNFSTKFLHSLSTHLVENTFSPEEIIYSPDESDYAIYFVSKGLVGIFYKGFSEALEFHKRGGHFGEVSFFTDFVEPIIAKSVNFSHIISLKRTEFLKLLEKHDLDNEMFHMIKDQVSLNENYRSLSLKCEVCELPDHPVFKCPKIHYRPKIQGMIEKYLREELELNKAYVRGKYRTKNARAMISEVETKAIEIRKNYPGIVQTISITNDQGSKFNDGHVEVMNPKSIPSFKKLDVEPIGARSGPIQDLNPTIKRASFLEAGGGIIELHLVKNASQKSSARKLSSNDNESSMPEVAYHGKRGSRKKQTINEHDTYVSRNAPFFNLIGMGVENNYQFFEFDRVKNFQIYMPHNNASKIIARLGTQPTDKIYNPFQPGGETEYLKLKLGAIFQRNGPMRKSFEFKSFFPKVDIANRRKSGI